MKFFVALALLVVADRNYSGNEYSQSLTSDPTSEQEGPRPLDGLRIREKWMGFSLVLPPTYGMRFWRETRWEAANPGRDREETRRWIDALEREVGNESFSTTYFEVSVERGPILDMATQAAVAGFEGEDLGGFKLLAEGHLVLAGRSCYWNATEWIQVRPGLSMDTVVYWFNMRFRVPRDANSTLVLDYRTLAGDHESFRRVIRESVSSLVLDAAPDPAWELPKSRYSVLGGRKDDDPLKVDLHEQYRNRFGVVQVQAFTNPRGPLAIRPSPDESTCAVFFGESLKLFEADTLHELASLPGRRVQDVCFSSDGERLFLAIGTRVFSWSWKTQSHDVAAVFSHSRDVNGICRVPGTPWVISLEDGEAHVWHEDSGESVHDFSHGYRKGLNELRRFEGAYAARNGELVLLRSPGYASHLGRCDLLLLSHVDGYPTFDLLWRQEITPRNCAFSPTGYRLAAWKGKDMLVWDLATRGPEPRSLRLEEEIADLVFVGGEGTILTATAGPPGGGGMSYWTVSGGDPSQTELTCDRFGGFREHDSPVLTLVCVGSVNRVISLHEDGMLQSFSTAENWDFEMGDPDEALAYLVEALEGRRTVLGDDHPDTLNNLKSVGLLLSRMGKFDEALPYFTESLEISRRMWGKSDLLTLHVLTIIGSLLNKMGKPEEALTYLAEALEGHRVLLGDDHPETLRTLHNMAYLLSQVGKFEEALTYIAEILEGRRTVLGADHPDTLRSVNDMGYLLRSMTKLDEARATLEPALDRARSALGHKHEVTEEIRAELISCYEALHEQDPALGFDALADDLRDDSPETSEGRREDSSPENR